MLAALRKDVDKQTLKEELLNSISHGTGILLAIAGLVLMVVFAAIAGSAIKVVSASIYGASLIILYSASTFYHAIQNPQLKRLAKVFDHTSIYIMIAGSYTPLTLITLQGAWGWSLFGTIWGLALIGVIFKLFFTGRFEFVSVAMYLLMGWLVMIAIKPLIQHMPLPGFILLAAGGLSYSIGVIFYVLDGKYHYSHFLWHLFVLAGSIFQFFAVLFYVIKV